MLKRLFTSNTRIKLLTVFLMNSEEEFFIRELTRKLDEQINSVRRELDNLKRLGLLKAKIKNRKKYYCVNKDFALIEELKSIIVKALSNNQTISKDIDGIGKVQLLALSGLFIEKESTPVDMLIVGDVDRQRLADYLNNDLRTRRPVKFTIMTEDDYKYRLQCKDKFVSEIIADPQTQITIRRI